MCFTHYTHLEYNDFLNLCQKRSKKFMDLLESNKKILFIYVSDEDIELQIKQYEYLIELENYLTNNYQNLNFKILSIGFIKKNNTDKIINYFYDKINNKIGEYSVSHHNDKSNQSGDFRLLNFFEIIFKNINKLENNGIFG